METKDLFKKLNHLKDIKPDNSWKKEYREVLLSQISAGRPEHEPKSNLRIVWASIMPRQIFINLAKPVWLASAASAVILIVGIGGVYASKNSKPGDSLYIAKIISEKAQFAMAFDDKDKVKLGVEFATNRAKEMIQVLKDTDETVSANNDKLEKLSQNFKKEINQVKNRLSVIKTAEKQAQAPDGDLEVFGANLGKNDQRMEIAEPATTPSQNAAGQIIEKPAAVNATSTPVSAVSADKMLEEAEKLVDEKNLDGAIDKLGEASKAIDQTETGQVKGESETATSTK